MRLKIKDRKELVQRELAKSSNCPITDIPLTTSSHIDHDHTSGLIRGLVSREGNFVIGKIENAIKRQGIDPDATPEILRAIADYLETPPLQNDNLIHWTHIKKEVNQFKALLKEDQMKVLQDKGVSIDEIQKCKNQNDRAKIFKKIIENE